MAISDEDKENRRDSREMIVDAKKKKQANNYLFYI